jgi:hypothetical protein
MSNLIKNKSIENISIETQMEYKPRRGYYKNGLPVLQGRPKGYGNKKDKWRIHCYNIETDEWETLDGLFKTKQAVCDRLELKNVDIVNNLIRGRCPKYASLYKIEKI